jgi:hypothetical protein
LQLIIRLKHKNEWLKVNSGPLSEARQNDRPTSAVIAHHGLGLGGRAMSLIAGGHTTLETKVIKRCDAEKMDRWLLPPDVIVKEQQLPSSQLLLTFALYSATWAICVPKPLWHFP